MKTLKSKQMLLFITAILVMIPGCVVISFYPLYEKEDLFNNELLTGNWIDGDSTIWNFQHPTHKVKGQLVIKDSAGYVLKLNYKDSVADKSSFDVNLIDLEGTFYLDFYLNDYAPRGNNDELYLYDLHVLPVHTFARIKHLGDSALIEWMNPDWLEKQFKENKIRIRHEKNENNILLTASPKEIQKFLLKYGHEEDVFEMDMKLFRLKHE